jgi:hypothetical protein
LENRVFGDPWLVTETAGELDGAPVCANEGQFWRANSQQQGSLFLGGPLLARRASWGVARNSMKTW